VASALLFPFVVRATMGCAHSTAGVAPAELALEVVERTTSRHFHARYTLREKLGRGALGSVYAVTALGAKAPPAAVKVLDLRSASDRDKGLDDPRVSLDSWRFETMQNEVRVMEHVLGGENICRLVDSFVHGCLGYIVVERCDATLRVALLGVRDLHEVSGVFGTPPFMSPEMLKGMPYGSKVNAWSFGVVAYVLCFGAFPYTPTDKSGHAMKAAIASGRPGPSFRSESGPVVSAGLTSWIRDLLHRDPEARASCHEALERCRARPPATSRTSLRCCVFSAQRCGECARDECGGEHLGPPAP